MSTVFYPRLIKRVRAVLVDSVVVPLAAVASFATGYAAGITETWARVLLVAVPVLLLEPGLVALTRGTVGHHVMGIRVTQADGVTRLNLIAATVRAAIKFGLGWFSFIFVLTTSRHQAIHDLVVGSVVTHRDASNLPGFEVLQERRVEADEFEYPPRWRRVSMIVLYCFSVCVVLVLAVGLLMSETCAMSNRCTSFEALLSLVVEILLLVSFGAVIVLGWSGRLPGARRRAKT
jgi:uncharacterized RDD family membrane protein YckC